MTSSLADKAQIAPDLGEKIRVLRKRLKCTLDETASVAGISKSFLSQIERGHATPSVASLVGIAKALGVTVQYFIDTPTEARSVHRGKELKLFGFADTANLFGRMTNLSVGGQLEAMLVRMPVGERSSVVSTRADEEFVYVVSGRISLTLERTTFVLETGDSAHFASTVPHEWSNTAAEEAVLVWVGTPALF
ncbi:helix-turn-helix domain-containing protein [Paraburkholderia flava]|uniref:helix-turn-helix domain-containing protein n=1 Tax=Paraburkholderia flava TaxID=2547393 RepID=UPI0010616791|nr:XRE family transcriptional regulator [Paraburkholderia flava]